jgi:hypothetical protein
VSDDKEREAFEEWWRTTGRYLTAGKSLARASWDEARTRVSPQGEPVAWRIIDGKGNCYWFARERAADIVAAAFDDEYGEDAPHNVEPLYAHPSATPRVEAPKVDPAVAFLDAMARAWVDDDTQEAHDKALLAARAYLDSRGAK